MPVNNEKMDKVVANLKKLGITMESLTVTKSRPSGKGGQKMQKTESSVRIYYEKLDITVTCSESREQSVNLYKALVKLEEKAAKKLLGTNTTAEKRAEKIRKAKQKRRSRSAKKYQDPPTDPSNSSPNE